MDPLVKEWTLFLDRCLENRISVELFAPMATQLHTRSPLPGPKLAALLVKPRSAGANSVDPRVVVYLECLLALKKVDASDLLSSTFRFSKDWPLQGTTSTKDLSRWQNPPELEEIVLLHLHKAFAGDAPERPITNAEGVRTLHTVTRWMTAMVTSHTSDSMIQAMAGLQQQPQQQSINVREALGMFVVGLVENGKILQLLNRPELKDVIRKNFARALTTFIPFLSQTSIQIANRLEISQKEHDLHDKSDSGANDGVNANAGLGVAALQLEAVIDLPQINTRAGLYIFLNSLLVARPLTDDYTINSYLHSCYKMDAQNMATDLVTASFDILANALYRNEPAQTMAGLKSFLMNRVPGLLTQLTTPLYAMNPELCITQALGRVDTNAFPAFSQGFDMLGSNNLLADVRQDFLNACALHGLISANTVERLLGEVPMQGPPETKYVKEELFNHCKDNFDKVNAYIDELENMDGNAGAIVAAITDFVSYLCDTQMTMYLKTLCNTLSKKTQALDVILQLTSPASILRPLCQFLDEWHYESDQGEYQPVYDEFSAILVLVLAFVYRYELTYTELGIGHDSFVAQFLERGHLSMAPENLTEEQDRYLGSWLQGLFDADKEGLSNDVFASCRPQDFYLIVPTIFSQTVMACSADVLSLDSVKGGLEYLHEPFLIPSLVGGLTWMASHALLQTHQDLDVLMQIFHKLIRSGPTSGDAHSKHSTILSIVSARLDVCFRTLKQRHPSRTDVEPLIQAIKPNLHYTRSMYSSTSELEQWTTATNNTLTTSLRHTVQQLSRWATTATLQPNPPNYTHRQIYTSMKLLGASKTLSAIVDEVKAQSDAGNGAAALDIGVSLICAPMVENSVLPVDWVGSSVHQPHTPRTHSNLREMLKVEYDNAARVVSTDPSAAETVVRLHRRVEAHLANVAQAGLPTGTVDLGNVGMGGVQSQNIPTELDKAMNDAAAASIAAAGADMAGIDKQLQQSIDQQLDLGAAGADLDLSAMGVGNAGAGGMSADMGNLPDLDLDMGDLDMSIGLDGEDDNWGLDFDNM